MMREGSAERPPTLEEARAAERMRFKEMMLALDHAEQLRARLDQDEVWSPEALQALHEEYRSATLREIETMNAYTEAMRRYNELWEKEHSS